MTIATCLLVALAIVAAEAMKRKQPDDPRWKLYLGCLVFLMFPLFAIAASRRWVASSRPLAFFLGGFLTICASELLVVVVASIHLLALGTPLHEEAGQVTDIAVLGGIFGIPVGLIRAFPMMPKRTTGG
jgi:hypothetical protein